MNHEDFMPQKFGASYVVYHHYIQHTYSLNHVALENLFLLCTVAGSGHFSIISVISQLLVNYFSEISRIFPVSCLFLTYFLLIS